MGSANSGRKPLQPKELVQYWKDNGFTIKKADLKDGTIEIRMYYDGRLPNVCRKEYKGAIITSEEYQDIETRIDSYKRLRGAWSTAIYRASSKGEKTTSLPAGLSKLGKVYNI